MNKNTNLCNNKLLKLIYINKFIFNNSSFKIDKKNYFPSFLPNYLKIFEQHLNFYKNLTLKKNTIYIFTDGGCQKNPSLVGSWAFVLSSNNIENLKHTPCIISGSILLNNKNSLQYKGHLLQIKFISSNIMEIIALIEAVDFVINFNKNKQNYIIITDSQYVYFTLLKMLNVKDFFEQNPNLLNKDLFKILLHKIKKSSYLNINLEFFWTKRDFFVGTSISDSILKFNFK